MNTQQLRQPVMVIRRSIAPLVALGLAAALGVALLSRPAAPAQQLNVPAQRAAAPWSPGGHMTGSVHDGGAYGVAQVEPWSPGGHVTGSVHDGGAYGIAKSEPWSPGGHLTGSVYPPR